MESAHLRQLAEIIDLGSMSAAARALHMSQPTLSRNIMSIEAAIGAPVIRRGRHGATPTAIGEALAREGRLIRDALAQAEMQVMQWQQGLEGRLRIGVGTMLAHSLIPKFLISVSETHWRIGLRIEVESANRLIERVRVGELDAAIVQVGPLPTKEGLTQITLFEDKRAFYVGTCHPLARQHRITKKDIENYPHISIGAQRAAYRSTGPNRHTEQLPGPRIELTGDVAIALHLLSSTPYIAALPQFVMENLADGRAFVRLAYKGKMPSRTFAIWQHAALTDHPLLKDFCRRFSNFVICLRQHSTGGRGRGPEYS